jgi:DNA-binding HxlR family transcriptional regulator
MTASFSMLPHPPGKTHYIIYSDYESSSTLPWEKRGARIREKAIDLKERPEPNPVVCARFHRAIELVGRRWTGAIVFVLLRSRARFAGLREAIPEITDRMLSERLRELEDEGIVVRTVFPEIPVRVEYALTKKGRALAAAIDAMVDWAHRFVDDVPAPEPKKAGRRG